MFSEKRKIRYSHLGFDKSFKLSHVLEFVQDAAIAHFSEYGFTLEKLRKTNSAWILSSTHLVIEKSITCEEIIIKTWPYDFSKVFSPRAFLICDAQTDDVLVKGSSLWFFIDTESGRPKRIPEEIINCFTKEENNAVCDVSFIRHFPFVNTEQQYTASFSVLKRDLDSNMHMNNVKYIEYAEEILPDHFQVKELEIYYKSSLLPGEKFSLYKTTYDNEIIITIQNTGGDTCTYIKFVT